MGPKIDWFYIRTVKRNLNEIEAQKKKTGFWAPDEKQKKKKNKKKERKKLNENERK